MKLSVTSVLSLVFVCYIAYSMLTFATLFKTLECSDKLKCYTNFLNKRPKMQLALFTSHSKSPMVAEVTKLTNIRNFDYFDDFKQ